MRDESNNQQHGMVVHLVPDVLVAIFSSQIQYKI